MPPDSCALLDLFRSEYPEEHYLAQPVPRPMPPQAVAPHASRKAVVRVLIPAFMSLDDMVDFPVTTWLICPAAPLEDESVAAKMAMAGCLVKDLSKGCLSHPTIIAQPRRVYAKDWTFN